MGIKSRCVCLSALCDSPSRYTTILTAESITSLQWKYWNLNDSLFRHAFILNNRHNSSLEFRRWHDTIMHRTFFSTVSDMYSMCQVTDWVALEGWLKRSSISSPGGGGRLRNPVSKSHQGGYEPQQCSLNSFPHIPCVPLKYSIAVRYK